MAIVPDKKKATSRLKLIDEGKDIWRSAVIMAASMPSIVSFCRAREYATSNAVTPRGTTWLDEKLIN